MRLFLAIPPSPAVRASLEAAQETLRVLGERLEALYEENKAYG